MCPSLYQKARGQVQRAARVQSFATCAIIAAMSAPDERMQSLCDDLAAEHAALDARVARLDEAGWSTPTPAEGWLVRDQIAHLACSDESARLAASDGEAFLEREAILSQEFRQQRQDAAARRPPRELLESWRAGRAAMLEALRRLGARTRLPWFGPPMSALTFATARLEETWAHGQDVADALGVEPVATDRLRHVAHLGVLTRAYSFTNQGRPAPHADVRVELTSPSGQRWTWGPVEAGDRVTGPVLDFCLVVTRRRHVADTDLAVEGPVASTWMEIAQAFAGPPGSGRRPGQFARSAASRRSV